MRRRKKKKEKTSLQIRILVLIVIKRSYANSVLRRPDRVPFPYTALGTSVVLASFIRLLLFSSVISCVPFAWADSFSQEGSSSFRRVAERARPVCLLRDRQLCEPLFEGRGEEGDASHAYAAMHSKEIFPPKCVTRFVLFSLF